MPDSTSWRDCLADIVDRLRFWGLAFYASPGLAAFGGAKVIDALQVHDALAAGKMLLSEWEEVLCAEIRWSKAGTPDGWRTGYAVPSGAFLKLHRLADQAVAGMDADGLRPPIMGDHSDDPVHRAHREVADLRNRLEKAQREGAPRLILWKLPDDYAEIFQAAIDASRERAMTAADEASTQPEESNSDLASIPRLDKTSAAWAKAPTAAKCDGVSTSTLATYRKKGKVADDCMCGIDLYGRMWRRAGTRHAHVWYLKGTLRREQEK